MKAAVVAVVVVALAWTLWPRRVYPHNPTTTTVLFNREMTIGEMMPLPPATS